MTGRAKSTDLDRILNGLAILAPYDADGDVSVGEDRTIFAGPEDPELPESVAQELQELYWEFDELVGRWGYRT